MANTVKVAANGRATPLSPVRWIRSLIDDLILVPWRSADEEWLPRSGPYRKWIWPVCAFAACLLALHHYLGHKATFDRLTWFRIHGEYHGFSYDLFWSLGNLFFYVLLPILFVKLFTPLTLGETGLSPRMKRRDWLWYLGLYLAVLPVVIIVSFGESFIQTYPMCREALKSPGRWLIWEIMYATQFLAIEYFYRGFLIHVLKRAMGAAAVALAVVPYCMFHFGKPLPETLGAIVAGTILGCLSLKTGSIWGGVALHAAVAATMDLLGIWHGGGWR